MDAAIIDVLKKGVRVDTTCIYAKDVMQGRFREEVNVEVVVKGSGSESDLMWMKIFFGRPPHYSPWLELFAIQDTLDIGHQFCTYFGSALENEILQLCARHMGPGDSIFVEYYKDHETRKQLQVDIPAAVTRLGHRLFCLGFTWFKDWYFPEGFMEGEQKLQGKIPRDDIIQKQQVADTLLSVTSFIKAQASGMSGEIYHRRAVERASSMIEEKLSTCAVYGHVRT